jgi:hypothetical protein
MAMGLFKRTATIAVDPDEVSRWRGRSAEIADAGALPWEVVFSALKTAPEPALDSELDLPGMIMAPLGLRFTEVDNRGTFNSDVALRLTNVFHGTRYGRPVLLNQGNQRNGQKGAMVSWVCSATPDLSLTASDGRLTVADTGPREVVEFVRSLSQRPGLWQDVHLVGGSQGIVVKRPIGTGMHSQGWIYDLWLAEHVAHLAGYTALPTPDPTSTFLPYGLDHAHAW